MNALAFTAFLVSSLWLTAVRPKATTALAAFEIAAAEMAVRLHVSEHGLDGGAATQLVFDEAEDAALLAGDEDAARIGGVMATTALGDIGARSIAQPVSFSVASTTPLSVCPTSAIAAMLRRSTPARTLRQRTKRQ
jgi:hypothetical protein